MLKTLAAAALVLGFASTAHAAPLANKALGAEAGQNANVVQVQHRRHMKHRNWNHRRGHWRGRGHVRRGPPPGWRRYSARPWNYRTRGCVMFGPVWFCP
jgi:Ni/Co efflux regulator RcnB